MKPVPLFGSETIGATVSVGRAREGNGGDKKEATYERWEMVLYFSSSFTSSHQLDFLQDYLAKPPEGNLSEILTCPYVQGSAKGWSQGSVNFFLLLLLLSY